MKLGITGGLAALAVAGVLVWWLAPRPPEAQASDPSTLEQPLAASVEGTSRSAHAVRPQPAAQLEPETTQDEGSEALVTQRARRNPERAVEIRRGIQKALREAERQRRIAKSEPGAVDESVNEPVADGTLPEEYIQDAVRDLTPLIKECYELALHADDSLAGKLVVEFWIVGDPDIGGIVEESQLLADGATLSHPVLDECVRETMYGLELPAPEAGGRVKVRYPFKFSQEG